MRRLAPILVLPPLLAACASTPDRGPATRGRLLDAASGAPLAEAVLVFAAGPRFETDARGRYTVRGFAPGAHRALVVVRGCRAGELDLRVAAAESLMDDIRVTLPALETLPPPEPPRDSPGRLVLAEELADMNVSTVSQALRRVAPEMVGAQGALGSSSLRGRGPATASGPPVPVLVVDGIVVYGGDTFALDRIPVQDVAWLEVLPGAVAGWEYGTGGAGGVIKVQTKRGTRGSDMDPADCPLPTEWGGQP